LFERKILNRHGIETPDLIVLSMPQNNCCGTVAMLVSRADSAKTIRVNKKEKLPEKVIERKDEY
jgi:hypothetical protein